MIKSLQNSRNLIRFVLVDIVLILVALYSAFLLRFDFVVPEHIGIDFAKYLPVILTAKMISFFIFGMYKGMWRYTSISDFINIAKASSLGSLLALSVLALIYGLTGFPRSVLFIDYALCTIFLGVSRASVRMYFSNLSQAQSNLGYNTFFKRTKKSDYGWRWR